MQHSAASRAIPVSIGALIAALAMVLLFVAPASADATLTSTLTGDQEVCDPADTCDDPEGAGVGVVEIVGDEICVSLAWEISEPATAAHIHEAAVGVAGPVVLLLFDETPDPDGTFEGCFTEATLATEIETDPENYYLNIHSETFSNGAIRGQLGVQALTIVSSYINPDTDLPTENPDVNADSSCETPDQDDTQQVSPAGETTNNVHNDACLFDDLGLAVDTQSSFESSGVGIISACPDPDAMLDAGNGPKESSLSDDALICTLDGYQESDGNMGGDFEYHARLNSEVEGTQTVVFCADPEGNGCDDAELTDEITITWEAAPEPETGMLMLMKHYCNADDSNPNTTVDVRSEEEFMEVEAGGMGDPIVAVALTVLACPVERLPGDLPVSDTIAHFEEEFDFLVTDSTGATFTLDDATFTNLHACEADDGRGPLVLGEVDGDEDTNVCVDFSFYSIDGVAEGEVTVVETFHEGEHEFGTVRFTPAEVDPDDDSQTLLGFDRQTSTVEIDTSLDGDAMVMLHIYNFDTAGDAAPTPVASELPDAALDSTGTFGSNGVAILVGITALASIGFVGLRSVAVRRTR